MSINTNIHFENKAFAKFNPGNCSLLLDISNTRGKLAIVDKNTETLLFLAAADTNDYDSIRELLFTLKEKLPCEPTDFSESKLMYYGSAFELVPDEWFIPDEKDHYLILHQKETTTLPTNVNRLVEYSINFLSIVPPYVKTAMDAFNGVFSLYHSGSVFIHKFRKEYFGKKSSADKLFCNFFKDGLEILIPEKDDVKYYNQVITSDPMEALFFLLNTMHTLEYPLNYGIVFCGDISPKSNLISTLKKTMPQNSLFFLAVPLTNLYLKRTKGLNPLQHENLIHLIECE